MIPSIVEERLTLIRELVHRDALSGKEPWKIEGKWVRFSIGDAHGNLKCPFVMGGSDLDVFKNSLLELAFYIKKGVEGQNPVELERLLSPQLSSSINIKELPPLSYKKSSLADSTLKGEIRNSLIFYCPLLDTGILNVWLDRKGGGSRLIEALKGIYRKSLIEEVRLEGGERTAYITHIAVLSSLDETKRVIRDVSIRGISYERWEYYIGVILYLILKEVIDSSIKTTKESFPLYDLKETELFLKSTLTPKSFVYIKEGLLKNPFNPYAINEEIYNILQITYEEIDRKAKDVDYIRRELCERSKKGKAILEVALQTKRLRDFKMGLLRYLNLFDDQVIKEHRLLAHLLRDEKALLRFFAEERYNREIADAIEVLIKSSPQDKERLFILEGLRKAAGSGKGWFTAFRPKKQSGEKDIQEAIDGYLAFRLDQEIEKKLVSWKAFLEDRKDAVDSKDVRVDYEKGKLYRFSSDSRPLIMEKAVEKEGYLFIDMKDFTRKTLRTKEVAMADFMKTRFFKPIIEAASSYGSGKAMAEEGMGVRLNNILGDAVVFSGNVSSLVYLADDIQKIMDKYRLELAEKISSLTLGDVIEKVKKTYEGLKKDICARKASSSGKELIDLMEEESSIENAYREDIEEIKKKEMVSGLYISYGTKAEQVSIKNDLWGQIDVAIGEKINEAARGAGRSGIVKTYIDSILEKKKAELNKPHLILPFSVYMGRGYSIIVDPAVLNMVEQALSLKRPEDARMVATEVAKGVYKDMGRAIATKSFNSLEFLAPARDIYNVGQVISEDALKAFIDETKGSTLHFRKIIPVDELSQEIRDRFLFLKESLDIWVSVKRLQEKEDIIVFRHVGRLAFKGLELGGAVTVYEVIKKNSEFYQKLFKHHLNEWIREAFKNKNLT